MAPTQALRSPALALAVTAAVALLALAGATRPLFAVAAGNEALARELDRFQAEALGMSMRVHGSLAPEAWTATDREIRTSSAGLGLAVPDAETGPAPVAALDPGSGDQASVAYPIGFPVGELGLYGRDSAVAMLPDRQGSGDGVWLPRRLAVALGVQEGDEIILAAASRTSVRVAGTYRDLVDAIPTAAYSGPDALPPEDPIAEYWRQRAPLVSFLNPRGDPMPAPPLIVTDPQTAATLGGALAVGSTAMVWLFPFSEVDPSVADAQAVQQAFEDLEGQALDVETPLGAAVAELADRRAGGVGTTSVLEGAILRPAELVAALDASLAPLAMGAQALGLLALAGVLVLAARRRRSETAMFAVQGTGPLWVGTRAAGEVALPALLGGLVGAGTAVALAARIGPLGGPPGHLGQVVAAAALGAGLAGLATAALVAALVRSAGDGRGSGRAWTIIRRLPWELLLAAGALASGLTLAGREGGLLVTSDGGAPQVDPLAVAFPLLLVATASAVTGRLASRVPRALARTGDRGGSAWYLATRRLAAGRREAQAVVAALALGAGFVAFGLTAAASTGTTIQAKASAMAGASATTSLLPRESIPEDLAAGTTEIARTGAFVAPAAREVELIAIDPATFADAAAWVDGFADMRLDAILTALSDRSDRRLPVLTVGIPAHAARQLVTSRYDLDIDVVAELRAFPGMRADRIIVVDRAALVAAAEQAGSALDEQMVLRRQRELWLDDDVLEADTFGPTHLQQRTVRRVSETLERPDLVAAATTLRYLRGVGVVAGVLALVLLLAYAVARERTRAAGLALAERMGVRPSTLRLAVLAELSLLLAIGIAGGGGAGLLAARLTVTMTDPVPQLPPGPLVVVPLMPLAIAGAVLAGAVVCAAVLADRARRAVPASQVLREG